MNETSTETPIVKFKEAPRHKCPVTTCKEQIAQERFMCESHWTLVPPMQQQAIIKFGEQSRRAGGPGREFRNAAQRAIRSASK